MNFIYEPLLDTLKLLPLLYLVYLLIEYLEFDFGDKLRDKIQRSKSTGPLWGSLIGVIPQCGFSVMAGALFAKRLLSYGTLFSIFISTSDEAIPVLLSNPLGYTVILPLLLAKVIFGIIFGYAIDFALKRKVIEEKIHCKDEGCTHHVHEIKLDEIACCGHQTPSGKRSKIEILTHPLRHTLKIGLYILIFNIVVSYLFSVNILSYSSFTHLNRYLQPLITALIGLIPNCAASVLITQLFMKGLISLGSLLSGLVAGAGLGYFILFKENKNWKENVMIVALMLVISYTIGLIFT